jgi:hypothetical protein
VSVRYKSSSRRSFCVCAVNGTCDGKMILGLAMHSWDSAMHGDDDRFAGLVSALLLHSAISCTILQPAGTSWSLKIQPFNNVGAARGESSSMSYE